MPPTAELGFRPRPDFRPRPEWNPNNVEAFIASMGVVSPLGLDVDTAWDKLKNGGDGMVLLEEYFPDYAEYPLHAKIGGYIVDYDPRKRLKGMLPASEIRQLARVQAFALDAAFQVLHPVSIAGEPLLVQQTTPVGDGEFTITQWVIDENVIDPEDIAIVAGTGIAGAPQAIIDATDNLKNGEPPDSKHVFNALFGQVGAIPSRAFGIRGRVKTISEECATGNGVVADGVDMLRLGRAKMVLLVAAESAFDRPPVGIALFDALPALTPESDPRKGPTGFNKINKGFGFAEGAAAMVLVDGNFARMKGIDVRAKVLGYGSSADAYHKSFPHPGGRGAKKAMRQALEDGGGLPKKGTLYVKAHATGTGADRLEAQVVRDVFSEDLDTLEGMSTMKPQSGHLLAAAGIFELAMSVRALEEGIIPATTKFESPDDVLDEARAAKVIVNEAKPDPNLVAVLGNSFGFGGLNEVIYLGKVK